MIDLTKFALYLDINKGDILLGGRFKNVRTEVKELGTDKLGQPTVNNKKLLAFRIEKLLPKDKMSSKTQEEMEMEKESACVSYHSKRKVKKKAALTKYSGALETIYNEAFIDELEKAAGFGSFASSMVQNVRAGASNLKQPGVASGIANKGVSNIRSALPSVGSITSQIGTSANVGGGGAIGDSISKSFRR